MELWDTLITFALIAAAAFYVYRKFSKAKKSGGGCGCGSESSCCSRDAAEGTTSHCNGHHH
ncbi:MAG: FeoB-associated Cys-rich membrane protein [Desulfuromonadales bacterium]